MSRVELQTTARLGTGVLERMFQENWLHRVRAPERNIARTAITIADVPGRSELIALLRKMAERWPPGPKTRPHAAARIDPGPPVKMNALSYFGFRPYGQVYSPKSEVRLTLHAMKHADISMLARAIPGHDRQEISRALETFRAFGILRINPREHRNGGYEFDPEWVAASEISTLLDVLSTTERRFDGRAAAAEAVMPRNRMGQRKKARKRGTLD